MHNCLRLERLGAFFVVLSFVVGDYIAPVTERQGLALQAGINYAITKDIGLFASIAKINVKSKVVAVGSTVLTTTVDFRPLVYSAGVSYQF